MATPDVVVNIGGSTGGPVTSGDIDQAFVVGQTQRGSIVKPMALQNLTDFGLKCGARQTSSPMYDWADTFNNEDGTTEYAVRVAAANAAPATLNLMDASSAVSLVVSAALLGDPDPGTWANGATGGLSVAVVVSSGAFQVQTSLNGVLVEASPYFSTQADAIGWAQKNSNYVSLALGASNLLPAAAAGAALAGGSDGSSLADTDYQAALNRIDASYGPGQIIAPGRVTNAGYLQVMAHAIANNRFALLDAPDTSSDSTIESAAQGVFSAPGMARRWAQMLGPWTLAPGLTTYTTRDVPPTALLAAAYSRLYQQGNPNMSAAGKNGVATWIQDLNQPNWSPSQRDALAAATVNVIRRRPGGKLMIYGNRTLADPVADANWTFAPNVRAIMWYANQARIIGEQFNFDDIDPFGHELAAYKGALMGLGSTLNKAGALWCPSGNVSDAISVDTGTDVNPAGQLAQGIELANVSLRLSPTPDRVQININKVPMTQSV